MEDSFRVWRQNAKSLTWPIDRAVVVNNTSATSSSSNASTSSSLLTNSNSGISAATNDAIKLSENVKNEAPVLYNEGASKIPRAIDHDLVENSREAEIDENACVTGGAKKKSKRRKNIAVGKASANARKNASSGFGGRFYRNNNSPNNWDTDFDGCWEMGPDLIKEFKQNKNNRNRSTSESAAYTLKGIDNVIKEQQLRTQKKYNKMDNIEQVMQKHSSSESSPIPPVLDMSFCIQDDDIHTNIYDDAECDDTLACVAELPSDGSLGAISRNSRHRLYQRAGSTELKENNERAESAQEDPDFDQYKAKFNNNIKALWSNTEPKFESATSIENDEHNISLAQYTHTVNTLSGFEAPNGAVMSARAVQFWNNYYGNQLDLVQARPLPLLIEANLTLTPGEYKAKFDEGSTSFNCSGSGALTFNNNNEATSDYYSMPSNMDEFERSVGGIRRNGNGGVIGAERNSTPTNMGWKNSVWCKNPEFNDSYVESDESFYHKVWNTDTKLNPIDMANGNKFTTTGEISTERNGNPFTQFPPYIASKWSEGINAGPQPMPQQNINIQTGNVIYDGGANSFRSIDVPDCAPIQPCVSSFPSATVQDSWQQPNTDNNFREDITSWSASNPLTLTELYINCGEKDNSIDGPDVTLCNHSETTSAFIAYKRVKAEMGILNLHPRRMISLSPPVIVEDRIQPIIPTSFTQEGDLLHSDETHFNPIKGLQDGQTFDICSNWDPVHYKRSDSGYLLIGNHKYLEYKRNEKGLPSINPPTAPGRMSTNPLYASSNCAAARAVRNNVIAATTSNVRKGPEFVCKFRVSSNEIGCQTENMAAMLSALGSRDYSMVYGLPNRQRNEIIFQRATEAVQRLPRSDFNHISASNFGDWRNEENSNDFTNFDADEDEISACMQNALKQQWSMSEIGKKCQLKGHKSINNNGSENVWGMCAACNSELKSVPANGRLRAELEQEADEIMSDLRYMRNLYIGDSEDEAEPISSGSDSVDHAKKRENKCVIRYGNNGGRYYTHRCKNYKELVCGECEDDFDEEYCNEEPRYQPETNAMLEKVNQLIVNLLQSDLCIGSDAESAGNSAKCVGSTAHLKFTDPVWSNSSTYQQTSATETNSSFTKPKWEYENLATIWQSSTPPPARETLSPTFMTIQSPSPVMPDRRLTFSELKYRMKASQIENLQNAESRASVGKIEKDSDLDLSVEADFGQNYTSYDADDDDDEYDRYYLGNRAKKQYSQRNLSRNQPTEEMQVSASRATTSAFSDRTNCEDQKDEFNLFLGNENPDVSSSNNQVQDFINSAAACLNNANIDPAAEIRFANRKRRHSAVQNIFFDQFPHLGPTYLHTGSHDNVTGILDQEFIYEHNSPKVSLLDNYLKPTSPSSRYLARINQSNMNSENVNNSENAQDSSKQTIVTCKYWTTVDPEKINRINTDELEEKLDDASIIVLNEEQQNRTGLPYVIDKNASILDHVTMAARPLTR